MSPDAERYLREIFLPQISTIQEEMERVPLGILVWGPGRRGGKLYEKRRQIRGELRKRGHTAVFSEEIEPTGVRPGWSLKDLELVHAMAADFIVLLYSSDGSKAETHDFADFPQVADKLLVFVDKREKAGYGALGALHDMAQRYRNVEFFRHPKDVVECNLLGKVLVRAESLRRAKWRERIRQQPRGGLASSAQG